MFILTRECYLNIGQPKKQRHEYLEGLTDRQTTNGQRQGWREGETHRKWNRWSVRKELRDRDTVGKTEREKNK